MKKIFLLLLVAFVLWLAFNRQRVFIRDPIATVYRANAKQSGAQVYFNFSNDILLEQPSPDGVVQRTILQHWNQIPGTPAQLVYIRWIACLTPADHAPTVTAATRRNYDPHTVMRGRHITFIDASGVSIRVDL